VLFGELSMKNIQNLLFDLDGTLVDSSQTISESIEFALERMGVVPGGGASIESVIGASLFDIFRDEFEMSEKQAYVAIDLYREHYDSLNQAGTRVYENIHDVLPRLKTAGYRLFIATVKPTRIAEKVLSDLGLRVWFDGIAGSSMDSRRRDKSSIIAHALRKYQLDPRCSIMIGDRDQDVFGARENGMPAIAVTYGFGSREELDSARPEHLVEGCEEIVSLLVNPSMAK
jgi:phosphoglycolate phosphatase